MCAYLQRTAPRVHELVRRWARQTRCSGLVSDTRRSTTKVRAASSIELKGWGIGGWWVVAAAVAAAAAAAVAAAVAASVAAVVVVVAVAAVVAAAVVVFVVRRHLRPHGTHRPMAGSWSHRSRSITAATPVLRRRV